MKTHKEIQLNELIDRTVCYFVAEYQFIGEPRDPDHKDEEMYQVCQRFIKVRAADRGETPERYVEYVR